MTPRSTSLAVSAVTSPILALAAHPLLRLIPLSRLGGERMAQPADALAAYGGPEAFFGSLAAFLTEEWAFPLLAAATAVIFLALILMLSESVFGVQDRVVADGQLGRQRAITRKSEIIKANFLWDGEREPTGTGVCIGFLHGRSLFAEATHMVAIAPSGSSKTRGSLFETLDYLTFSRANNCIVTDPSLEIWAQSHKALEDRGYNVLLLDLEDAAADRYNPLLQVAELLAAGDAARAQDRAREIGAILYPKTGGENDWVMDDAAGAFAGIAYAIASSPDVPIEQKNLWTCLITALEGTKGGDCSPLKLWLEGFGVTSPVCILSAAFRASSERQESAILSTLLAGFQPFATQSMRRLSSLPTFAISSLFEETTVLFIRTLAASDPRNKVASLLLAQHYAETARRGAKRGQLRPCFVLADEAHVLPKFDLVTAVEQGRKYSWHYFGWYQSASGLDKLRTGQEDGKDALLANCDVKILYKAGSKLDAEYFSALSGEATVLQRSEGDSKNAASRTSSVNWSEQRQPVWPPGDILQRDPMRDGILVVKSITGHPERSGCFEVPIADVTKTPTARNFAPAFGTREHEATYIVGEVESLEGLSASSPTLPDAWVPDYAEQAGSDDREGEPELDLFGV